MDSQWWHPNHMFFGDFYEFADQSVEGYDVTKRMNREQRTEREIELISKYLSLNPQSKILDCPCGNGRHSLGLARKGSKVVGVDINEIMISIARKQIQSANTNGNLSFYKMDMRDLKFEKNSFDYIINMFLSFGFFNDEDNEKVVKEFFRLLKPGGKLLVHLDLNYDRVISGKYLIGDQHITRECRVDGEYKILEINERYDEKNKRLIGEWILINGENATKNYSLRVYDNEKEFIPLFKKNGFSSVILNDPENKRYSIDSKETILVAIK